MDKDQIRLFQMKHSDLYGAYVAGGTTQPLTVIPGNVTWGIAGHNRYESYESYDF